MISTALIAPNGAPALVSFTVATKEWVDGERLAQFQNWLQSGGYAWAYATETMKLLRQALPESGEGLELEALIHQVHLMLQAQGNLPAHAKRQHAAHLEKLREFVLFQRGQRRTGVEGSTLPRRLANLPVWVRDPLSSYLRMRQRNWPAHTMRQQTQILGSQLGQVADFFIAQHHWSEWNQLCLRWMDDYVDAGLRRGLTAGTLNVILRAWQMVCCYLREEGYAIGPKMTQLTKLVTPHRLPRPLSDEQTRRLEEQFQLAISSAKSEPRRQQAIMDLAWFYLMWHCGLRIGEVQRLTVQDLDLDGRKLLVRDSKERKDRQVYLSDTTVKALRQHLTARSDPQAIELFTYHHRRLTTRTIRRRLMRQGKLIQVTVSPHRLRHTFATQMLNAGMPITSLQRYLGHEQLDTTLGYAEVRDPVLQQDYYRGIVAVDPSSLSLGPTTWTPVRQAELERLLKELKSADPKSDQPHTIWVRVQQLLGEVK
jgi:integrase/recombinase XerD